MFGTKSAVIVIALIAVAVRLIAINQPFIDRWSWRQSDVAAIARNYSENGFHFARPQIDWAGNAAGYVGTEFPILPFVAALLYKCFGVHEWIARIQGVIFFTAALPFFFLLVRGLFGVTIGIWATFFYSFAPLSVVASRAFMPDMPSLSLAIVGLYFYLRWLQRGRASALLTAGLCTSIAVLIKLPTAIIGAPLLYLTWQRFGWRFWRQPEVWVFAAFALVPPAIWYWHAQEMAARYYPFHFFGGGGLRVMNLAWYGKIVQQTVGSSLTPILFFAAAAGVFLTPRGKYTRVFQWWCATMMLFIVVVGWGNRHQWYQLPLVPIAAVFGGIACRFATRRLAGYQRAPLVFSSVVVLLFGGWSLASARAFYESSAAGLRDLGLELKKITPRDAFIIAADDGDPTVFYYARRKGWHFLGDGVYWGNPLDDSQIIANLEKLRGRGARYLVFYAGTQWWVGYYTQFGEHLKQSSTLLEKTPDFTIYQLSATPPNSP
ncbi:MAG: ArnT family glycosyltransferase [Chthoniobacterales bacterium]